MREIRGAPESWCFPDGHSALMLCAARLRHVAGLSGFETVSEPGTVAEQDIDKALELAEAG